ncbi:MAG: hypothetical protein WC635_16145 [Bacteriovorax sp.]|jgi:hypothetical protein
MKYTSQLQDLNEAKSMNFRDEAYEECRVFSLERSFEFVKNYPKFSAYKDIFAKILFINSISSFLQNKLNEINSLPNAPQKTQGLISHNLLVTGRFISNLFKLIKLVAFLKLPNVKEPRIGIELSEGLRSPVQRSDINFNIAQFGFQNIVLFDFQNVVSGYNPEELANLRECLDNGTLLITGSNSIKHSNAFKVQTPVIKKFIFTRKKPDSNSTIFFEYLPFIQLSAIFWKYLFKKLAIKGWLHTVEIHLENLLQVKILKELGAVSFSRQRSEMGSVKGLFYQPADVLFNWSHLTNDHFQKLNFYEVIKPIGHYYLNINKINAYQSFSKEMRKNFPDGTFIISLFDNIVCEIAELSAENFKLLIRHLLDLLKATENIVLSFKLKKKKLISQYPFRDEIEDQIKKNRIILYDGYLLPLALGMESDLSIGVGASSPIWEINIAQKRGIYFWPGVGENHPLSNKELENLLCRSIEEVKKKIHEAILNPDSKIGLITKQQLTLFDEFHDFKAPERVAFCFKKLLETNVTRDDFLKWIRDVDLREIN